MRGELPERRQVSRAWPKADAQHWVKAAADGDHSRLAFDKPNTWSQKYNLVWDKILGLNVFPPSVAGRRSPTTRSVLQPYGVPLDSRTHLTKSDWSFWSATLADNPADFETLISPIYAYLNQTTARLPVRGLLCHGRHHSSDGMHARPVIGGLFIKMLADAGALEEVGARRPAIVADGWAGLPVHAADHLCRCRLPSNTRALAVYDYRKPAA